MSGKYRKNLSTVYKESLLATDRSHDKGWQPGNRAEERSDQTPYQRGRQPAHIEFHPPRKNLLPKKEECNSGRKTVNA